MKEKLLHKEISLKDFAKISIFLFLLGFCTVIPDRYKIIPYFQDSLIAYNHDYEVMEGDITQIDRYKGSKTKTEKVKIEVCGKFGSRRTITFEYTLLKKLNEGDHCKIEYLPHLMIGMNMVIIDEDGYEENIR